MYRSVLVAILVSLVAGCVSMPAQKYQPGIASTQELMKTGRSKMAVDRFDASKGVDNSSLDIRGSQLTGAGDGSFSTYLHDALQSELEAAGRYDPAATARLSGTLTVNDLESGVSVGKARVGARFVLTRQHAIVFDKVLTADHQWDSSFVGAIAIPAAMQNYTTAVQKLAEALFSDPDFVKANQEDVPASH